MDDNKGYREFSSIEEYTEEENVDHILSAGLRIADEKRRKTFKVRGCPMNNFERCKLDDCALFDNEKPGLPWWGKCRLGRWPVEK